MSAAPALLEAYYAQVREMADRAETWMKANPAASARARIVWHFPKTVLVVAVLPQAEQLGLVSANDEGRQLLHAMHDPYPPRKAPTLLMLRVALEAAKGGFR